MPLIQYVYLDNKMKLREIRRSRLKTELNLRKEREAKDPRVISPKKRILVVAKDKLYDKT